MTLPKLQNLFERLRRDFFPRWDRKREWRFRWASDLDGLSGRVERATKTIAVLRKQTAKDLRLVLIHEMAHAATDDCHGKRWLGRLVKAMDQAQRIGMDDVAQLLREEIDSYGRPPLDSTPTAIYQRIEEILCDAPHACFGEAMDSIRRDYGMSREQFSQRYRRARAVFDAAKVNVHRLEKFSR